MKITEQQIARFDNEIRIFAKKFGLIAETEHTLYDRKTDVRLSSDCKYKRYVVEWDDVPNFATAMNGVIRDASVFFGSSRKTNTTNATYVSAFEIRDVIFNDPATIVLWADGTKTVVKCQEDDVYSPDVGLAMCFTKKALGNKSNFNNVFKKWVPEANGYEPTGMVMELNQDMRGSAADVLISWLRNFVDLLPLARSN